MTVKELRTLVDNLDEYIHIPGGIDRLKKTVLHLAVSGQLVPQDPTEGTGEELYQKIQAEKQKLINEGKLKKQKPLPEITAEEVTFDIPKSWKWVRFADVYDVRDGTHDTPKYIEHGYPLVTSKNLSSGKLDLSNIKHISKEDHLKIQERSAVTSGDILFAMIGSIGNPAIVDIETEFSIKNVALFKPYNSHLYEPSWLLHYLEVVAEDMKERSAGGVQSFVSLGFVRTYPAPLPSILEQIRISQKVKAIFKLIDDLAKKYTVEENERRKLVVSSLAGISRSEGELSLKHLNEVIRTKADAAELRKAILHLAVSGRLVPQDPSEGTGEELYEKIQAEKARLIREGKLKKQKPLPEITEDEIPFEIPKSWQWARLADATIFSIGRTPARKNNSFWDVGQIPWVSIADLKAGKHIAVTKEKISRKAFEKCFSGVAVPAGSLLYSFKLTLGKMSIIDMDAVHNEAIASFNTFSSEMTAYLFKTLEIIDPTQRSNSAIMGKTLNSSSLSMLEIPLPPLAEQNRIIQKTEQLLFLVTKLEKHLG